MRRMAGGPKAFAAQYRALRVPELRSLAELRHLPSDGCKRALVERLSASDAAAQAVGGPLRPLLPAGRAPSAAPPGPVPLPPAMRGQTAASVGAPASSSVTPVAASAAAKESPSQDVAERERLIAALQGADQEESEEESDEEEDEQVDEEATAQEFEYGDTEGYADAEGVGEDGAVPALGLVQPVGLGEVSDSSDSSDDYPDDTDAAERSAPADAGAGRPPWQMTPHEEDSDSSDESGESEEAIESELYEGDPLNAGDAAAHPYLEADEAMANGAALFGAVLPPTAVQTPPVLGGWGWRPPVAEQAVAKAASKATVIAGAPAAASRKRAMPAAPAMPGSPAALGVVPKTFDRREALRRKVDAMLEQQAIVDALQANRDALTEQLRKVQQAAHQKLLEHDRAHENLTRLVDEERKSRARLRLKARQRLAAWWAEAEPADAIVP